MKKWQNRRSLKIAPLSSSLLSHYSASPAAFPQPGLRVGKIYKRAPGRMLDAVGRAGGTGAVPVIGAGSGFLLLIPHVAKGWWLPAPL